MPISFCYHLVEGAKVTKQVNDTLKKLEKEINDVAEQYKAQAQGRAQAQTQAQAQAQAQGSSSGTPDPSGSSIEQHYYEQILRMQAEAEAQAQAQTHAQAQAQSGNSDGGSNQYDPAAHEYRMRMAQERMGMLGSIGTNRVRVAEVNPISNARYSKPPGVSHGEHMSNLRILLAHDQIHRSAEGIDRLGNIG